MTLFARYDSTLVMRKLDGRKLDHKTLEEIRIRAVKQVQNGESPETVIKTLGFTSRCIYSWLASYRAGGWDALRAGKATGRPKKLSADQIKWIYKTITGKNPLQLKFSFALWTRPLIRTAIYRKFGIKLSLPSIGRLLAQLGLTCQKPLSKAIEKNPTLVNAWLKKDFPKLQKLAKREKAEIFFGDESGVRSDFHSGTTWAIKGQTPIVQHTGRRFSLNMISAISNKGEMRFMTTKKRISAKLFLEFCKRLMTGQQRKIYLIVDGHPSHKAKIVKSYIESLSGKLKLFYLPPYSPELNPDEYVWNDVKNNGVGRSAIVTPKDLNRVVVGRLRHIQKNPDKIRAFFQSKTTRYAA